MLPIMLAWAAQYAKTVEWFLRRLGPAGFVGQAMPPGRLSGIGWGRVQIVSHKGDAVQRLHVARRPSHTWPFLHDSSFRGTSLGSSLPRLVSFVRAKEDAVSVVAECPAHRQQQQEFPRGCCLCAWKGKLTFERAVSHGLRSTNPWQLARDRSKILCTSLKVSGTVTSTEA